MAVRGWRHRAPGSVVREHLHTETREALPQDVLDRIARLEQAVAALQSRLAAGGSAMDEPRGLPDLSPMLEAISHLSQRVAELESRPVHITMEPDPRVEDLQTQVSSLAKHLIAQETATQKLLQAADNYEQLIMFIMKETKTYDPKRLAELRKAG